jgi:hypothetical protein
MVKEMVVKVVEAEECMPRLGVAAGGSPNEE